MEKATLADLEEVLGLFDAVQAWLVKQGLREQWGDTPFPESEAQRRRFAVWLDVGDFWVVRRDRQIVGILVSDPHRWSMPVMPVLDERWAGIWRRSRSAATTPGRASVRRCWAGPNRRR